MATSKWFETAERPCRKRLKKCWTRWKESPTDCHPVKSREQSAWVPSSPNSAHSLRKHSSSCQTTTRQGANAELALARSNDLESQSRIFPRRVQSAPRQIGRASCRERV